MNKPVSALFGLISILTALAGIFAYAMLLLDFLSPGVFKLLTIFTPGGLMINLCLFCIFALQHSVMARPAFKSVWTRLIPQALERNFYVMFTGFVLLLMGTLWQRQDIFLYDLRGTAPGYLLMTLPVLGLVITLVAGLAIDPADLTGIKQMLANLGSKPEKPMAFKSPGLYRYVRHPLYTGMILMIAASPAMTVDQLYFALLITVYILVAIQFEEKILSQGLEMPTSVTAKKYPH